MIELLIVLALAALTVLSSVPAGWYAFSGAVPLIVSHTGVAEPFGRGGPYWQYHWERFRLARLPYLWGLALFAGLTALLIGLAVWGFLYDSADGRGILFGAWIADALLSHVLLRLLFPGPNPGLRTSLLYLLAVAVGLCWFEVTTLGVALGAAPFVAFHAVSFALKRGRACDPSSCC
ncbi:MAG TPA: hypothetical protein VGE74_16160 [Gemmata sp.]